MSIEELKLLTDIKQAILSIDEHLQFKRDFNEDFNEARNEAFSKELNPELQNFDQWLSANASRIPIM